MTKREAILLPEEKEGAFVAAVLLDGSWHLTDRSAAAEVIELTEEASSKHVRGLPSVIPVCRYVSPWVPSQNGAHDEA